VRNKRKIRSKRLDNYDMPLKKILRNIGKHIKLRVRKRKSIKIIKKNIYKE